MKKLLYYVEAGVILENNAVEYSLYFVASLNKSLFDENNRDNILLFLHS